MTEWMLLTLLFAAVFVVTMGAIQWAARRRERFDERLEPQTGDRPDSSPDLVLGGMTPALAGQFPVTGEKRTELQAELREAGYYRPTALMEYTAVRAVLILLPLLIAGVLAVLAPRPDVFRVLLVGAVVAVLGFSLPRVYVNYVGRQRKMRIEKGLPVAVDLLSLGLLSGQNILAALQRVSQELRFSFPDLAYELNIVLEQARMNTLPHALQQWAERARIPEVNNLVMILTQTQRQGADVAAGLMEFSNNFRSNLRQRADAQASRAGFYILFPALLCLWLPAMIVLVGPVFYEFRKGREEAQKAYQQSQPPESALRPLGAPPPGTPTPLPPGSGAQP